MHFLIPPQHPSCATQVFPGSCKDGTAVTRPSLHPSTTSSIALHGNKVRTFQDLTDLCWEIGRWSMSLLIRNKNRVHETMMKLFVPRVCWQAFKAHMYYIPDILSSKYSTKNACLSLWQMHILWQLLIKNQHYVIHITVTMFKVLNIRSK